MSSVDANTKSKKERLIREWDRAVAAHRRAEGKSAFGYEWGWYMSACVPVIESFQALGISALKVELPYSVSRGAGGAA